MFYYLYEIRNNLNGKIYVGVHKTKSLNDGYMGSGKVLQRAIAKHGAENFTKVVLETFENAEAMYAREKEVVTDEFLLREDTYNLRRGGNGGFDYINKQGFNGAKNQSLKMTKDERIERAGKAGKRSWELSKINVTLARKSAKKPEAIKKRKETFRKIAHQQGEKNSSYGTCWIYHDLIGSRKCKKELLPEYIEQGWNNGRKIPKLKKGR
jgi:hypothetical protein